MAEKAANYGPDVMRMVEKSLLLQILDQIWKEHLLALDHLRQGIGLRAYGQRDPLNEYKREAFDLFEAMLERLREQVTQVLAHIELRVDPALEPELHQALQPPPQQMHESRVDPAFAEADACTGTRRRRQRWPSGRHRRARGRRIPRSIRAIPPAGAGSPATPPAPAAPARSSSTATAAPPSGRPDPLHFGLRITLLAMTAFLFGGPAGLAFAGTIL